MIGRMEGCPRQSEQHELGTKEDKKQQSFWENFKSLGIVDMYGIRKRELDMS